MVNIANKGYYCYTQPFLLMLFSKTFYVQLVRIISKEYLRITAIIGARVILMGLVFIKKQLVVWKQLLQILQESYSLKKNLYIYRR